MKQSFLNLSKSGQCAIVFFLFILNVVFVPTLFTSCKSNMEKEQDAIEQVKKVNQSHADSLLQGLIKKDQLTLAETISLDIIKNPLDWKDSTDAEEYSNAFLWIQCERWVNIKCNIKLDFRIDKYNTYEGYIKIISHGDTVRVEGVDFQRLAPTLDTILVQGAVDLQEMKEKNRIDSIRRIEKIKEDRILKNFCK